MRIYFLVGHLDIIGSSSAINNSFGDIPEEESIDTVTITDSTSIIYTTIELHSSFIHLSIVAINKAFMKVPPKIHISNIKNAILIRLTINIV